MTQEATENQDAARRDGSALSEGLGPAPTDEHVEFLAAWLERTAWQDEATCAYEYEQAAAALRWLQQKLKETVAAERERMRAAIADDAYAATFQSMGQYRSALLRALRA